MSFAPRGFTLMEMLVVLVIAGLLAGLLFSSLQSLGFGESRLADRSARQAREIMVRQWWLDATRSLAADRTVEFGGGRESFRGLATQALNSGTGHQEMQWRIVGGTRSQLQLETGGAEALVLDVGAEELRFAYLDEEQRLQPKWPPAQGLHKPLPVAVVLISDAPSPRTLAIARIEGPREPVVELFSRETE